MSEVSEMEMLTVKEVAGLLKSSVRLVWKMRDSGRLPQPVKLSRLCRWRKADIEAWVRDGCPPCRPAASGPRSRLPR